MNASQPMIQTLPVFGQLIEGGYFHGIHLIDGKLYGEVTGPAADCYIKEDCPAWLNSYTDVLGATSESDGLANTLAMLAAGSPLAESAAACRSGGYSDWYLPARVGALLQFANLKPLLPEAEAFDIDYLHWVSTQRSHQYAWLQYFDYGDTLIDNKDWPGGAARFVRRIPLNT